MYNNTSEEKILAAALDIIAEKTISNTRMHLIAEKYGMAQSNVHYYFKTKDNLLIALLHKLQDDFNANRAQFMAKAGNTLEDQLRTCFKEKQIYILEKPEYDYVQFDYWSLGRVNQQINDQLYASYNIWRQHIKNVIQRFISEIPEEEINLLSTIVVSMMLGTSIQYLNKKESFDVEQCFDVCVEMVLLYLAHQKNGVQPDTEAPQE